MNEEKEPEGTELDSDAELLADLMDPDKAVQAKSDAVSGKEVVKVIEPSVLPLPGAVNNKSKVPTVITVKPASTVSENTPLLHLVPVTTRVTLSEIHAAQAEVKGMDVLVCGKCHTVFHHVPEFTEHKSDPSCLKPPYRTNINETKPQVWAFLLWKANASTSSTGPATVDGPDSSWEMYKRWGKLPQPVRDAWVAAGNAIQMTTTLGSSSVKASVTGRKAIVYQRPREVVEDDDDDEEDEEEVEEKPVRRVLRKVVANSTPTPTQVKPKAKRSRMKKEKGDGGAAEESSDEENYVVEKILAKRFNPKRKQFEYLLKWEGYPSHQNTWEPVVHMQACDKLVEVFERSLAKQKSGAKESNSGHKVVTKVVKLPGASPKQVAGPSGEGSRRPVRSSKTRAMENVKSWCGSIGKRKTGEDSDSDEPSAKKIKAEDTSDESDDENDEKTPGLLKSLSLVKSQSPKAASESDSSKVNGLKKSPGGAPKSPRLIAPTPPVLVANAMGVIKVDPRQVPNLTSGVYIVSNQSGVVKLGSGGSPQKETPVVNNQPQLLPRGSPKSSSGLVRVPTPYEIVRKPVSPRAPLFGSKTPPALAPLSSPRLLGARNPLSPALAARPGLRPPFVPRPPNVLRPPTNRAQTPTRGATPRGITPRGATPRGATPRGITPRGATPRGIAPKASPAAQVKSGVRPIQAMLGDGIMTVQVPKKKPGEFGGSLLKSGVRSPLTPAAAATAAAAQKQKKQPRSKLADLLVDFKETDEDDFAMGYAREPSESEEDTAGYILPDLPSAPTPSPPHSPLPLTLCPETGKILGQAEGEPTPHPSPEAQDVNQADECEGVTVTRLLSGEDDGGQEIKMETDDGEGMRETEYVTITGEDGIIYQIATDGHDLAEGETVLYLPDDGGLESAVADAVAQLGEGEGGIGPNSRIVMAGEGGPRIVLTTGEEGEVTTQAQVVAQIVDDEETPGAMRRVVLLLPDGSFMMTEVDEEQYLDLNLDK